MGVLTANVIARYVLATGGFDWAEEVPEQVFPWFIMAGVALAVQHGGHIAVEWLSDDSAATEIASFCS
jgi:TRAP-type transport system small permease protein